MTHRLESVAIWFVAWAALLVVALSTRPLLPVDETRYAAVAWEMWQGGDFLVPHLNGQAYSHKPPLLFWLIHAGWWLFGVSEEWLRLVAPAFGLASLAAVRRLARKLWPDDGLAGELAPLVLLGSALFAATATLSLFDLLLVFFVVMALSGVADAARSAHWSGWMVFGLATGLGILSKGPVMVVFTLPVGVLAPWWLGTRPPGGWVRWYLGLFGAVVLAAAIALGWALPAAAAGGPVYAEAILWSQSSERIVESFAHERPLWWYVAVLPVLFFPWTIWPRLWRAVARLRLAVDPGFRFCLCWFAAALVVLTLFSGKQPHYVLPFLPALALIAARALSRAREDTPEPKRLTPSLVYALLGLTLAGVGGWLAWVPGAPEAAGLPGWAREVAPWPGFVVVALGLVAASLRIATPVRAVALLTAQTAVLVSAIHLAGTRVLAEAYDLNPAAQHLAALERQERPIAQLWTYHGQYHFLGRLTRPIEIIDRRELAVWLRRHPDGRVIVYHRTTAEFAPPGPEFTQPFRGRRVAIWEAQGLGANTRLFE